VGENESLISSELKCQAIEALNRF